MGSARKNQEADSFLRAALAERGEPVSNDNGVELERVPREPESIALLRRLIGLRERELDGMRHQLRIAEERWTSSASGQN